MKRETVLTLITGIACIGVFLIGHLFFHPKAEQRERLLVGFLYDGDESIPYTSNFIRAQHVIEEKYGDQVQTVVKSNVSGNKIDFALEEMVQEGCQLIFSTSYTYAIITKEYAEKYPSVQFCQALGDNSHEEPFLKNYHTFAGEIHQGRYVSGIVAGMKLKELISKGVITDSEAKVGYVGAYPYAEVISGYTAFLLGVRSIVPSATMTVAYTYTWGSFSLEKLCAEHLIEEGCVIISQHSDTSGPAVACERYFGKNVFAIGYNQSMITLAPSTALVSTRINWIPYVTGAVGAMLEKKSIEKSIKGNVHGNDIGAGFEQNWVQMLDLNDDIVSRGTAEKVAEAIQAFKKGKMHVFQGDYIGVNPYDENDTYDLRKEYKECTKMSAPTFKYVLQDVITVEE